MCVLIFTVKTQRYEQDKESADLLQGVYIDVNDQNKTQA